MSNYNEIIKSLPNQAHKELQDFVMFLKYKYPDKKAVKTEFAFDWEGDAKDINPDKSSVEIQHEMLNY